MPKQAITDPFTCPSDTGPHELRYHGKVNQEYSCSKCGGFIKKAELKQKTDKLSEVEVIA